jgi:hypothetical protein
VVSTRHGFLSGNRARMLCATFYGLPHCQTNDGTPGEFS